LIWSAQTFSSPGDCTCGRSGSRRSTVASPPSSPIGATTLSRPDSELDDMTYLDHRQVPSLVMKISASSPDTLAMPTVDR
jgi:hypothetical protein